MRHRAIATVLTLAGLAVPGWARAEIIDGVAAIVNGNVITISEAAERAGPALPAADTSGELKDRREIMLKRATDELITEKVVQAECKTQNLEPTAADINEAMANIRRANHDLSEEQLEEAIKEQGLTMPKYRDMLSLQLCRVKLIEMKVKPQVTVPDDEVKAKMVEDHDSLVTEELKIRDIYVPFSKEYDAEKQIRTAQNRLAQGVDFGVVAKDTGGPLASMGGDLGWMKLSDLATELQKTAGALPKGAVSGVVLTKSGYHLLKIEDRRATQDVEGIAAKREQVRQALLNEKLQKATDDYIQGLRRAAEIQYRLE